MAGFRDVLKAILPQRNTALENINRMLERAAASTQNTTSGAQEVYPEYRYGYDQLWELAQNSDTLRITHQALSREILRNGFDLTTTEDSVESDLPQSHTLTNANSDVILKRLSNVNANRQDVMDVLEELERDYEVYDDNYLLFRKRYAYNAVGEIIPEKTELQEILRADPRGMGLVINTYDEPAMDNDGNKLSFCPEHRDTILTNEKTCKRCGKYTLPACFVYSGRHGKVYYSDSEMMHDSKYWPSKRLGTSPIISIWMKIRTLLYMDKYIMQMYDGQRPPKSILAFKSMSPEKVQKQIDAGIQRMKSDPHFPLTIGIPNSDSGKEFIQFVDLMRSLQDLQHTDVRNELRSQIGAVYGVEPIYQNDVSTGGGLNNEGLQITVTNRTVEWGQRQFNRKILPRILEEIGGEGLRLTLQPSEEQDESARLQRQRMALENARMASELGLEVDWDDKTGEATIQGGRVEKPNPMGGMFGGMGGPPSASGGTPSFKPKDESSQAQSASGAPMDPSIGKGSRQQTNVGKAGRAGWTSLGGKLKELIDDYAERFLNEADENAIRRELDRLRGRMQEELEAATREFYQEEYAKAVESVERELDRNLEFGAVDQNAIRLLSTQPVLYDAYAGLTDELIDNVNDILTQAYQTEGGVDRSKLESQIEEATGLANYRAENIARTETGKVSAAARKNSYQKDDRFPNFRFRHVGPNDSRTTQTSKRIKERVGRGVPWDEYVQIVKEESARDFPEFKVDEDAPISHYQSRHTFLRVQDQ